MGNPALRNLGAIALAALPLGCGVSPTFGVQRLNVVVVLVDTLRADAVGVYGSPRPNTPNLDAIAARGTVWEDAISQAPWTVPSVASLFTGVDPLVHHCLHFEVRGTPTMDTLSLAHDTLAEQFQRAGYSTAAFIKSTVLDASLGYDQGFDTYRIVEGADRAWGRSAADLNAEALPWLMDHAPHRAEGPPFFAYLHYMDPHSPYHAPAPYDTLYDSAYEGSFNGAHVPIQDAIDQGTPPSAADWNHIRAQYDGEVAYWDHEFGELYSALDAVGLWQDTLLVVLSDHGEAFFEHADIFHQNLYQENVRVVALFVGPGVPPGRMTGFAELTDVAPTVAELAKVNAGAAWTGTGRAAAMRAGHVAVDATKNRVVLSEFDGQNVPASMRSVIDPAGLKLVVGDGPDRLFDLRRDPGETADLARLRPDDVERLHAAMVERLASDAALGASYAELPSHDIGPQMADALRNLGYLE